MLEAQIALERLGISPGSIDGVFGSQAQSALRAFQREWGLAERGELDATARVELILDRPPLTNFVVLSNDLARLQPVGRTWLEKSRQGAMDYETLLELVAEKSRANPNLIRRLNPRVNWTNAPAGTVLVVPDARPAEDRTRVSWITIKLQEKVLQAFDAEQNLVAHFPCSIARRVEKRPVGDLFVAVAAENPDYTFDPAVFPESAEARQLKTRLLIPPGPNNPVGTAPDRPVQTGVRIHGTPAPEQVGADRILHGVFPAGELECRSVDQDGERGHARLCKAVRQKNPASAVYNSSFELAGDRWNPHARFRLPVKACRLRATLKFLGR